MNILKEADKLVHGDRQDDYGHPIHDFSRTGRLWAPILEAFWTPGEAVPPEAVALCMAQVKVRRECNQHKDDNLIDGADIWKRRTWSSRNERNTMSKKNNRHTLVYLAGKYSEEIGENIQAARETAIKVWEAGFTAICPHLNTAFFEKDCSIDYEDYREGDFEILNRCDAVLMLEDWEESAWATREHEFAKFFGISIYYNINELLLCDLETIEEKGEANE